MKISALWMSEILRRVLDDAAAADKMTMAG